MSERGNDNEEKPSQHDTLHSDKKIKLYSQDDDNNAGRNEMSALCTGRNDTQLSSYTNLREKRRKELQRERQRRYLERHRDDINQRKKDYRQSLLNVQQNISTSQVQNTQDLEESHSHHVNMAERIITAKSNAQRSKEYRERLKLKNGPRINTAKSNAQRSKEYRERLKLKSAPRSSTAKSNAQRVKEYRERQKRSKADDKLTADSTSVLNYGNSQSSSTAKSGAQRVKEYRERQKRIKADDKLSADNTSVLNCDNSERFPIDPDQKKKWADSVGVDVGALKNYSCIGSCHFQEEVIDRTSLCCVRLQDDAVPCINLSRTSEFIAIVPELSQEIIARTAQENTAPHLNSSQTQTSTLKLGFHEGMRKENETNSSESWMELENNMNCVNSSNGSEHRLNLVLVKNTDTPEFIVPEILQEVVPDTDSMDFCEVKTEISEQYYCTEAETSNSSTVTREMSTQTDDCCSTEFCSTTKRRRSQRDFGTCISPVRIINSSIKKTLRKELLEQRLIFTRRIKMLQQKQRRADKRIASLTSVIKELRDKKTP